MNIEKKGSTTILSMTPSEGLSLCSKLLEQLTFATTLETFAHLQVAVSANEGKRSFAEVMQFNIEGKKK